MNGFEIAAMLVAGVVLVQCWVAGPFVTRAKKHQLERLILVGGSLSLMLFLIGWIL